MTIIGGGRREQRGCWWGSRIPLPHCGGRTQPGEGVGDGKCPEGTWSLESGVPASQAPRTGDTTYKSSQQVRTRQCGVTLRPWCCSVQLSTVLGRRESTTSGPFPLRQPFAFCPLISLATRGFLLQHWAIPQTPLVFIHFPVFFPNFGIY